MQEQPSYLQFDMDEVNDLEYCYQETLDFLLDQLPDVNWNSRLEVKDFFESEYNLTIISLKISYLKEVCSFLEDKIDTCPYDLEIDNADEAVETLKLLIEYYKTKYAMKNYIRCIQYHEKGGRIYLRDELLMPNKQPLPYSPDIISCITATNSSQINQHYEGNIPLI